MPTANVVTIPSLTKETEKRKRFIERTAHLSPTKQKAARAKFLKTHPKLTGEIQAFYTMLAAAGADWNQHEGGHAAYRMIDPFIVSALVALQDLREVIGYDSPAFRYPRPWQKLGVVEN